MGSRRSRILEPAAATLGEAEPNAAPVFAELARVYMMTDRAEEAVNMAEKALRAAAPQRDTEVIVNALVTRGSAICNLGAIDEAEAILRGAMNLADRAGHIAAALRARNNLIPPLSSEAPAPRSSRSSTRASISPSATAFAGSGAQHLHVANAGALFEWATGMRPELTWPFWPTGTFSELHAALSAIGACVPGRRLRRCRQRMPPWPMHASARQDRHVAAGDRGRLRNLRLTYLLLGECASAALDAVAAARRRRKRPAPLSAQRLRRGRTR